MQKLNKAIIEVMKAINNLQKDKQVGSGYSAYRAVTGAKVRSTIRQEMIKNGLTIYQTSIEYTEDVARWVQDGKQKQQVRMTANVKYLLSHVSGESIELQGIGTGVDSQDKAAGKATSYALKYALLNLFLIPTSADPDEVHSDDIPVAPAATTKIKKSIETKQQWAQVLEYASRGKAERDKALSNYTLTEEQKQALVAMYL